MTSALPAASRSNDVPTAGSLSGMRVLDLSWLIPGPFCTGILSELGAEVIKIERPKTGDYMREDRPAEFEAINRGKRSIALDLKSAEGKEIFYRLCRNADVVIEGFSPGVVQRLGIDYEALCAINPGIVYLSLSGYGQSGPYAHQPGHDLNYMATAGALAIPGRWGDTPQRFGLPIGDFSSGLYAVINIQSALMKRASTGRGEYIDLAISDALLHWAQVRLADAWQQPAAAPGEERWWIHLDPANEVYQTKDHQQVSIALIEEKFTQAFRAATGHDTPEYDSIFAVQERCTPKGALRYRDLLTTVIAGRSFDEWNALLQEHRIPLTRIAQPHDVFNDAHFRGRGMLVSTQDGGGNPSVFVPMPGRANARNPHSPQPAPKRGEHTSSVLQELGGVDAAAFADLQRKGIVE